MPTFYNGDPVMVDHTPGSAVAAGDVVIVDRSPRIAHSPIAANALGAVACHGGVYRNTADGAIANGRKVFWDNSAKKITLTATGNLVIGVSVSAAAADGDEIKFFHNPDGNAAA